MNGSSVTLDEFVREKIISTFHACHGSVHRTADRLEVMPETVYRHLYEAGLVRTKNKKILNWVKKKRERVM